MGNNGKVKTLELQDVSKSFGGLRAVNYVTTTITAPSIVGLIGPNGAGKTTLTNCNC
jgi:ABC-type branched-subunit amino acid transport system ATPase component